MPSITPLTQDDFSAVRSLQPDGWGDIMPHIDFYVQSSFCYPIKLEINRKLAGIGAAIILGHTAWLAHIIVHPDERNKGIGGLLTKALIELVHKQNCTTIFLIATKLGEPVYRKAGFEFETDYIFLKELSFTVPQEITTVSFNKNYEHAVLRLDRRVSGEDRSLIIRHHFANGHLVIESGELTGYYLPSLGEGLIVADTETAGFSLMQKRLTLEQRIALPENNKIAIEFLMSHGAKEFLRGKRMRLGQKIPWHPDKIYSRIGGNLG